MTRLEANREIIRIISEEIEKQPDIRFSQLMRNIGVISYYQDPKFGQTVWINEFNFESDALLERIQTLV